MVYTYSDFRQRAGIFMQRVLSTLNLKRTSAKQRGLYFDSCTELPLYNLIKIIVTKDLKWLIKEGNPTNLETAWANIYSEYCEISGDQTGGYVLDLSKEISYLTNRLTHVQKLVDMLLIRRNEDWISILQNELGFKFSYSDLEKDLKRTVTLAKSDLVKLQKKQSEYDSLNKPGKETTEQDYTKTLQVLSKFQGYQVRAKDITVSEYVEMIKDYNSQDNGRQ